VPVGHDRRVERGSVPRRLKERTPIMIRSSIAAMLLVSPFAGALPAFADDDDDRRRCTDRPRAEWMGAHEAGAIVAAEGYFIREIEVEGGCYQVKALMGGNRVVAYVDPVGGGFTLGSQTARASGASDDDHRGDDDDRYDD
jgi:hypothetical protein